MPFYKAVRCNGLSFHGSPRVSYTRKNGTPRTSTIRPAPWDGERQLCGPGMLHVSDEPAETLIGCSWPCRLFEVEIVGGVLATDGHKRGVAGLRIVRELPAHMAFGPMGEHVAALIERAVHLTSGEVERLDAAESAAWDAAPAAWEAAWFAARDAAWDTARGAASAAAWDAAPAAWDTAQRAASAAARSAAQRAALSAAEALVVRDLIGQHGFTQEHYDTLTTPWRTIIGPIHPDDPAVTA